MLSTPCRSVREVLNHTALKPDLVIRAMYRQDKIYQDPCTSRVKNYQDCVQPKQSIIRVVYRQIYNYQDSVLLSLNHRHSFPEPWTLLPCTIDTLPIPKMSIVRFLLLTLATIMHPPCAPKSFNFKAFSESVHCTK